MPIYKNPLELLSETPSVSEIKLAISYVAVEYGINKSQLIQTLNCESGFKYDAKGDHGLAYGVAQFHKPTFDAFCKGEYTSARDQLICMAKMWKDGYQFHWSCWKQYFTH